MRYLVLAAIGALASMMDSAQSFHNSMMDKFQEKN